MAEISPESKFASELEKFKLKESNEIFELVDSFKSVAASKALEIGEKLMENSSNAEMNQNFEFYDLETKLWHLFDLLYSYRYSPPEQIEAESSFSSWKLKVDNFLKSNQKLRELVIISYWLQVNSKMDSFDISSVDTAKFENSIIESQKVSYSALNGSGSLNKGVDHNLDPNSFNRSGGSSNYLDNESDSKIFAHIYRLVLSNKIEEAIRISNEIGNFSMSLILIGYVQEYYDPVIDGYILPSDVDTSGVEQKPFGIKHKLLWRASVYKLSQMQDINAYERLIYNYLSGGDFTENINLTEPSWDDLLLLYVNQALIGSTDKFILSKMPEQELKNETLSISLPNPEFNDINGILNVLSKLPVVSKESGHPLRVISGGIMIGMVPNLLSNILNSQDGGSGALMDNFNLLRVITHISILHYLVDSANEEMQKIVTRSISLYVSALQKYDLDDLAPIYLSFIPNESDTRERYAEFLGSFLNSEDRLRQIQIAKKFFDFDATTEESSALSKQEGFSNVLRRTVEKILAETASEYAPKDKIEFLNSAEDISETDLKLCHSVDWYYENSMYEDAIIVSVTILRRLLLNGKISTFAYFVNDKDFKQLIKDYDFSAQIKQMNRYMDSDRVNEEVKEELLSYQTLAESLILIDDWKKFMEDNQINGSLTISNSHTFWKSKHITMSLEKILKVLNGLISTWLIDLIELSPEKELFVEFRGIYIPYIIMELLQIYQYGRLNNSSCIDMAFELISDVANDDLDYLSCFISSGRMKEFLERVSDFAVIATENGIEGLFPRWTT